MAAFESADDAGWECLVEAAVAARARAYAPYSRFRVGAAILTDTGAVVPGCNVENVSYGLTNCAERVAIGAMVAQAAGRPVAIAVISDAPAPITPCGACRQVLAEFAPEARVLCCSADGSQRVVRAVADFLPGAFDVKALESGQREQ